MNVRGIVFDPNSFGITEKSLRMLRNTLAEKINREIYVVEVPTNDLCCGYFIFDLLTGSATFTGDGFRTDGGGEGGAGYKSAKALLNLYGIYPVVAEGVNFDAFYVRHIVENELGNRLKEVAEEIIISCRIRDEDFRKPASNRPEYIR